MRIVYMGTPHFAAQILKGLLENKADEDTFVALYAQPDRQAGRGKKLQEPETKILAKEYDIPVYQPETFRNNPEALKELKALKPDVLVVAAYGMLLPQEVLDVPIFGAFNVHASLLPKYRGAAPVQRSLMAGDSQSGVTIMRMEVGLDSGPIVMQQAVPIEDCEEHSDNTQDLLFNLGESGIRLMGVVLKMIREQRLTVIEQNHEKATHAAKLTKQEAHIDWSKSSECIHNHIRGFSPNPGATASLCVPEKDAIAVRMEEGYVLERLGFGDADVEILMAQHHGKSYEDIQNGAVLGLYKNYIVVKCAHGHYGIRKIRLAGKASMDAKAFNNGYLKNNPSLYFA